MDDSYILSGETIMFSGEDSDLAGEDLGFLPMLAAAVAPRLMQAALPMASSLLSRGGGLSRIMQSVRSPIAHKMSRGVRLPKGIINRATKALAEGKSPQDAFMSAFSEEANADSESRQLSGLNGTSPIAKIAAYVRSTLPRVDNTTKTAVRDTATTAKISSQNTPKSAGLIDAIQQDMSKADDSLAKMYNPSYQPSKGKALIMPSRVLDADSSNVPSWQDQFDNQTTIKPSKPSSGLFDDDGLLWMMLFAQPKRRKRRKRYSRRYYRSYRPYRRYYRPRYYAGRGYARRGGY